MNTPVFQKHIKTLLAACIICAGFSSCRHIDVFEKNVSVPNYQWKSGFVPSFDFEITDTTPEYNLFVVLRHTDAYHYNNIWVNVTGLQNKDTLVALPHLELLLGTEDRGWEGTGMDDIWEVRKPINKKPVQFKRKGLYRFTVAQVMREDPLENMMSVGFRVEKVR